MSDDHFPNIPTMQNQVVQKTISLWRGMSPKRKDEATRYIHMLTKGRADEPVDTIVDTLVVILNCGLTILTSQDPEFTEGKY